MPYIKAGREFKTYRGVSALASADASTGTWKELENVVSCTVTRGRTSTAVFPRGNSYEEHVTGLRQSTINIVMAYREDDGDREALELANANDTVIAIADMDGDITVGGSRGIAGNYKVADVSVDEPENAGPAQTTFTLVPVGYQHDYTVAS